jgi:hypothetical protein
LSPRNALGEFDALQLKRIISGLTAVPTCGATTRPVPAFSRTVIV